MQEEVHKSQLGEALVLDHASMMSTKREELDETDLGQGMEDDVVAKQEELSRLNKRLESKKRDYAVRSRWNKGSAVDPVDAVRVNRLFRAAERERVDVRTRRLSAAQLWAVMCEEETLVVALVDARRLPWASAEAAESTSQFVGHFVLLLAVDEDRGGYIVTDPGAEEERCFVHFQDLEAARRADGTDEDLLLIPAFQSPPTPPPPGAKPKIARVCEEESVGEMREAENEATEAADRWSRWMESVRGGSSSAGNSGAPARAVPMPLMRTRSRTRSFDSDERLSGASIPELELEASPMDDVPARPLSSGGMSRLRPIKSGVELNHMDDDPGADIAAGHWPGQISPRMSPRGQAPWVLT